MKEINENYKYIHYSYFFKAISTLFKFMIFPLLFGLCKLVYGYKVIGKENLNLVKGSAVSISNHIHIMDTMMVIISLFPKPFYFCLNQINFKTYLLNVFLRLLGGIPVPDSKKALTVFIETIQNALDDPIFIHFFPEASIVPYSYHIRQFKDGAFRLAINKQVPIIAFTFIFQKPNRFRAIFRKKPCINLVIDKPLYSSGDYHKLKTVVLKKMESTINNHQYVL